MSTIQFLQTTPEDLVNQLTAALLPQLKAELAEQFQPKQPEELLTIDEVCKFLKINRSTEGRWRAKGIINPSNISGTYYYFRSEILKILNDNKLK